MEEEEGNVNRKRKNKEERGECFRHIRRYRYIESGSTPSPLLHHIWSSIFYLFIFFFIFFFFSVCGLRIDWGLSLGTQYTFSSSSSIQTKKKKKMKSLKDVIGIERVQFVIRLVRLGESSFVAFL